MLEKVFTTKRSTPTQSKVCKKCSTETDYKSLKSNYMICPECGAYFRMNSTERIAMICDKFNELDKNITSKNILSFPNYSEKLKSAISASGENEA
ncbi:MAG: acetyl-CoA carboxylase carboxyl transferase subunit beta, partial [Clostridia bacterium]|nr:acetyl-CoA carboxylase carboxyl transferase subunit beta [Clostridia bacterium]